MEDGCYDDGMINAPYECAAPYVVDGDSIRCGRLRLRLLGIDAPELNGCPRHRRGQCAPGDPTASRRSLQRAVALGPIRYSVVSVDRFGRSVAMAWVGRQSLSCWQLKGHQALYKRGWDNGRLIARTCPAEAVSFSRDGR